MKKKIIFLLTLCFLLGMTTFASGVDSVIDRYANYDQTEFDGVKNVMDNLVASFAGRTDKIAVTGYDLSKAYKAAYIDVDYWSGKQKDLDLFAAGNQPRWFVSTRMYSGAEAISELVVENGVPRWIGLTFTENDVSIEQYPAKGPLAQKLRRNNYEVDQISYLYTSAPRMTAVALKVGDKEYVLVTEAPPFHGFETDKFYTKEQFAATLKQWKRPANQEVPLGGGGSMVKIANAQDVKLLSDKAELYESPAITAAAMSVLVAIFLALAYVRKPSKR